MIATQCMLFSFHHERQGPPVRLDVYSLNHGGEGREMVATHRGFPDTVPTLLSLFLPITQCVLIPYLENTIILSFM